MRYKVPFLGLRGTSLDLKKKKPHQTHLWIRLTIIIASQFVLSRKLWGITDWLAELLQRHAAGIFMRSKLPKSCNCPMWPPEGAVCVHLFLRVTLVISNVPFASPPLLIGASCHIDLVIYSVSPFTDFLRMSPFFGGDKIYKSTLNKITRMSFPARFRL